MMKLTTQEREQRKLNKRLYGDIRYSRKSLAAGPLIERRMHEVVVETVGGKRRLILLVGFPGDLDCVTFGKRVFVRGEDNVFRESRSEAFYSLPAGVVRETNSDAPADFKPSEGIRL